MYSRRERQLRVARIVMSYWLHRVNLWESFPCVSYEHGPLSRCAVSIPTPGLMENIPAQYDVFCFARTLPNTTGFIFLKAYGSGRFVDLNVDDSSVEELAYKYILLCYPNCQTMLIFHITASYLEPLFGGVTVRYNSSHDSDTLFICI